MSKKLMGSLVLAGLALLLFMVVGGFLWGIRTREIKLRNAIYARQDTVNLALDKVTKVISQKGQVTGKYADDVKEVVIKAMEARYRTGGELVKAVQEATGQTVDPSLYRDLSQTIEGQREGYFQAQTDLRAWKQEHDDLIDTYGMFLPGKQKITVNFITSAKTKEAIRTGEENDIDVFKK